MSSRRKTQDHPRSLDVFAGSLAGATATVITHPLEVLQTRLQSSTFSFKKVPAPATMPLFVLERNANLTICASVAPPRTANIFSYAKGMIENEGYSLFSRGLLTNVAAFSLSRGIYFSLYSSSKEFLRNKQGKNKTESTPIHVCSAALAGFASSTLTNPIWLLKTRLQLEPSDNGSPKLSRMLVTIYREGGIRAFYSGLTASYLGIVETAIHFAIYEYLKSTILQRRKSNLGCETGFRVFDCVVAAAVSKTIATVLAYPHEVIRTRMREQNQEKSFLRLIRTIMNREGWQGFYGGLGTHLFRQVPNTAIVFLTYESIIYFGTQFLKTKN